MVGNLKPVKQIVSLFGGQAALGRVLGIRQGAVWLWIKNGRVPSSRIMPIIRAAAALDPPVELRPDHFFSTSPVPERETV